MTNPYSFTIIPFYAQVWLFDPACKDIPEIGYDVDPVVFNESVAIVFTRPDHLGAVRVTVGNLGDCPMASLVHRAEMSFPGGIIRVGSIAAGDLRDVSLSRAGSIEVEIYVSPLDLPENIHVLLPANTVRSVSRVLLQRTGQR